MQFMKRLQKISQISKVELVGRDQYFKNKGNVQRKQKFFTEYVAKYY